MTLIKQLPTVSFSESDFLYYLALHIMDKWLKKSVEVDDDESSVDQKKEKSSQSKTSKTKRKKVVRRYDDTYLKMGFTWNEDEEDPRPRCVICYEQLANESMRPDKLLRDVETKHPELKHKPLDFFKKLLANLKTGQRVLQRYTNVNEKSLYVSYLISLRIVKAGKPHTIGETLVLSAIKDTVKVFFGDKSKKKLNQFLYLITQSRVESMKCLNG